VYPEGRNNKLMLHLASGQAHENRHSAILFYKVCVALPFVLLLCLINPCLISWYSYMAIYIYICICISVLVGTRMLYGFTSYVCMMVHFAI
jgi:hypothetical protein